MMCAYLIVKSDASQINKENFDQWYETEHLLEAKEQFGAIKAKRGWIENTNYHLAFYEFENIKKAKVAINSKNLKELIKKFDKKWNSKVTRSRELVNLEQIL